MSPKFGNILVYVPRGTFLELTIVLDKFVYNLR